MKKAARATLLRLGRQLSPDAMTASTGASRAEQIQLKALYQGTPDVPREFVDVEFSNTSQEGTDGILLYLLALMGRGSRRALEVCAGSGLECNVANLILHHGWEALLLDGDPEQVNLGRDAFREHPETKIVGPAFACAWISAENIAQILHEHGYASDVDLISLDMDGIDYWILKEMIKSLGLSPRIIVAEYNNRVPADQSVTVPYARDFIAQGGAHLGDGFCGASLAAFNKLLEGNGYRLVGADRNEINAFFVRSDLVPQLPTKTVEDCLTSTWSRRHLEMWDELSKRDWQTV